MRAAAHLSFNSAAPKCPKCRKEGAEGLRVLWGCDAPAVMPQFIISCPRCDGYDPKCPTCEGRGEKNVYRCPASQITPDVSRFVRAYVAYQNGVLPDSGGAADQAASFFHALSVFSAERASIEAK